MKNTKLPFIILIAILLGVGSYLLSNRYYSKSNKLQANNTNNTKEEVENLKFQSLYKKELKDIYKLRISNSNEGTSLETTDKNIIKEFMRLMNGTTFLLDEDQEESEGTAYYVDLVENEDESIWFRINFPRAKFITYSPDSDIKSSQYYKMNNSDEIMTRITDLYKSLK